MIGLKNVELVLSIKKKEMVYYGHIKRRNSLQKLVLKGKVVGKRGRGQGRKSWTGNVSEMTKMSMAQCSVKALERSEWRRDGTPMTMMMIITIISENDGFKPSMIVSENLAHSCSKCTSFVR